jgi:hypothetical protein
MYFLPNATAQAERFTWKSANYGGAVEFYTVEVDKGMRLKHLCIGFKKTENQASVSVETMNGAALTLKSTPLLSEFEVRVKSTVGTQIMLSNVVGIIFLHN